MKTDIKYKTKLILYQTRENLTAFIIQARRKQPTWNRQKMHYSLTSEATLETFHLPNR